MTKIIATLLISGAVFASGAALADSKMAAPKMTDAKMAAPKMAAPKAADAKMVKDAAATAKTAKGEMAKPAMKADKAVAATTDAKKDIKKAATEKAMDSAKKMK